MNQISAFFFRTLQNQTLAYVYFLLQIMIFSGLRICVVWQQLFFVAGCYRNLLRKLYD
jgi:hypothetical protein